MIGELSFFLGLQIKQMKNGTFMSQGKYIKDMLKKFGMDDANCNNPGFRASKNMNFLKKFCNV